VRELRVIDALQRVDRYAVSCPADWKPGEPVTVPPPSTALEAEAHMSDPDLGATYWYFLKKDISEDDVAASA